MNIDWSKAPPHATHWCPGNAKIEAGWIYNPSGKFGEFYSCYADKGLEHIPEFPEWRKLRLVSRPSKTDWNGEGLPPIGADVECTFAVEDHIVWHRGVVVYRGVQPEGDDFVVVKTKNASACYREGGNMVRPYRTPEQIAAEVREKDIEELRVLLSKVACDDYHAAVAMIDAGYRKFEIVDDQS